MISETMGRNQDGSADSSCSEIINSRRSKQMEKKGKGVFFKTTAHGASLFPTLRSSKKSTRLRWEESGPEPATVIQSCNTPSPRTQPLAGKLSVFAASLSLRLSDSLYCKVTANKLKFFFSVLFIHLCETHPELGMVSPDLKLLCRYFCRVESRANAVFQSLHKPQNSHNKRQIKSTTSVSKRRL